ncbi:hypothetical protein Tco_0084364 [Tanacetum coccineum]
MPTTTIGCCLVVAVAMQRDVATAAAVGPAQAHSLSSCVLSYGIYRESALVYWHVEIGIRALGYRELGCIREMSQSLSSNVPDNSPEQEAAMGHFIPRRLDSPTSQATQLPELELTLTPATGRELSQEINNHSVPTLISQAPGPSRKRSRSPSSPLYPDATTFSDGKPAFETPELHPEDVTARLEDIEVEIDTL